MYQVFVPLLLIAFGHGIVLRERESRTLPTLLAQGLNVHTLVLGKAAALLSVAALTLIPALLLILTTVLNGESIAVGVSLFLTYGVYLFIWGITIVLTSLRCHERGWALSTLLVVWLGWTLVVPRVGVAVTGARFQVQGKLETDLRMQKEIREAGDGHNAKDPAFRRLRANLLAQYDVDQVEDLPINIRGVVAETAEASLTDIMNRYADERMTREAKQARSVASFGWVSPTVAVGEASRALVGTDVPTHHRFLREAEALRFDFVQGLNRLHAHELKYGDDINRSRDPAAERRTRVSADHWSLLKNFTFARSSWTARLRRAGSSLLILFCWSAALMFGCNLAVRRLKP